MNKIGDKYLPIGTVVMLKGGSKRVMITGFCTYSNDNKTLWDYNGCFYPEGILSSDVICTFNHDQIGKVYHMGLSADKEEKEFKKKLKEIIEKNINSELGVEKDG